MLGKIFKHFVAPRAELAAERLAAKLRDQTAFRVLGQNMEPTLPQNSIAAYRTVPANERLERGTVIVFTVSEFAGQSVPSRIIAIEGDRVALRGGKLLVNEQHVLEPYVKTGFSSSEYSTEMAELEVPAGSCFVLGDYRDASKDSRILGPIPRSSILGIVVPKTGEA